MSSVVKTAVGVTILVQAFMSCVRNAVYSAEEMLHECIREVARKRFAA